VICFVIAGSNNMMNDHTNNNKSNEDTSVVPTTSVDVEFGATKNINDNNNNGVFVATDPENGLTDAEVEASRAKHGTNEIPFQETPLYVLFLRQYTGFLPFLIELAAIISLGVEDYTQFGIIAGILLINGVLGFREEYHAKKSLDELSNSLESEVNVRRNGETHTISTKEVVPGDIILLVGGTILPADVKWIRGDRMQIDTAALTGEPIPRKYPSPDYGDVILAGTTVVAGECYAQVLLTGTNTEIGKAQEAVFKDKSVRVVSFFQQKIMQVVQILVTASLAMVIAVLLVDGIAYDAFNENIKEAVLNSLGIMIASIPVALPLVLQVNLALGAAFLAKHYHAIVTSIPALQDIASMSILCS
jgi:H+-transporting ATPase